MQVHRDTSSKHKIFTPQAKSAGVAGSIGKPPLPLHDAMMQRTFVASWAHQPPAACALALPASPRRPSTPWLWWGANVAYAGMVHKKLHGPARVVTFWAGFPGTLATKVLCDDGPLLRRVGGTPG